MRDYSSELRLLSDGSGKMGLSLDEPAIACFRTYLQELETLVHNLTAVRIPKEVVTFHFLDSLSVLPVLRFASEPTVCDLGSGAGFPLLPLKIVRPEWKAVFVDSRKKSVEFIGETAARMGLSGVRTIHGHSNEMKKTGQRPFCDELVVRALGPVARVLEQAAVLVKPGGRLILYKGPGHLQEMDEAAPLMGKTFISEEILPVEVPFLDRERYILTFRRNKPG